MNAHLAYFIDKLEINLKGAKAAHDWIEAENIYKKLQELYTLQESGTSTLSPSFNLKLA